MSSPDQAMPLYSGLDQQNQKRSKNGGECRQPIHREMQNAAGFACHVNGFFMVRVKLIGHRRFVQRFHARLFGFSRSLQVKQEKTIPGNPCELAGIQQK